ncbi:MAG: hypothetical protein JSR55_10245 [Proteobacteria bacterium]|nr:hypothetical protein [Pseudomonadota bacterium]
MPRTMMKEESTGGELAAVIQRMLNALSGGDRASFERETDSDFACIDVGRRMSAQELFALVASARDQGKRFEWKVTAPRCYALGAMAFVDYRNRGTICDAEGVVERAWLESALLVFADRWRVRFFHSSVAVAD